MSFFKRALSILDRKLKFFFLNLFVMMLLAMMLETLGIAMILPIISVLLDESAFEKYTFLSYIYFLFDNPSREKTVIILMLLVVTVYLFKTIYLSFFHWVQSSFVFSVKTNISKRLFSGYVKKDYDFHLNKNSSTLIRNIITEIDTLTSCYYSLIILMSEILVFTGISIFLTIYQPLGFFISFIVFTSAGSFFYFLFKNKILAWGNKRQVFDEKKIRFIQESFGGIKELKINQKESIFIDKFFNQVVGSSEMGKRISFLGALPRFFFEFILIVIMSAFVIFSIRQSTDYSSDIIPTLGLYSVAAFRLMPSITKILSSFQGLRYNKPVIDLIRKELDLVKNIKFPNSPSKNFEFTQNITVKDLSFNYSNRLQTLKCINLKIEKGKKIGLVGHTGSGKSTLVDLMLGLLKPKKGTILIDGFDLNQNLYEWQKQIGYVPQNIFLTDDSLKNNIAFGFEESEIDEKKLMNAIKYSNLEDFIQSLDDGVSTFVGERGLRLSGGQKQRIGIARALYNEPSVLVFDESTSALDQKTEEEITKIINKLDKTMIIIAHRKNTLKNCDIVYELINGSIKESNQTL
jgi:ATP-binding cassette, subfamily B, bacterial PglK